MTPIGLSKARLVVFLVYLLAAGVAIGVGYLLRFKSLLFIVAAADLAATAVVFLFSILYNNSSLYDPYWSVAPILIAGFWLFMGRQRISLTAIIVLLLVVLWGVRLTGNWLRHWRGLDHEDWRYRNIRSRSGVLYWPASFAGIHLLPTVVVFLGCLALYPVFVLPGRRFGILDLIALVLTITAIVIETVADAQLHRFKRVASPKEVCTEGLWAWSRHPNYFGEILFWWGLYVFALAAWPRWWWTIIGPLSISALFLFISIPMMERRMRLRRPTFESGPASRLVPLPLSKGTKGQ